MFEQAVEVSEALRQSASHMQGTLRMALKGCPDCGTAEMIASPELGLCTHCGSAVQVLSS